MSLCTSSADVSCLWLRSVWRLVTIRTNESQFLSLCMCVVTGTGGSSSASAAVGVCQCDGCALSPEPVELLVCTGPWGGGAPLWGTTQRRDIVTIQTFKIFMVWFKADLYTCIKMWWTWAHVQRDHFLAHVFPTHAVYISNKVKMTTWFFSVRLTNDTDLSKAPLSHKGLHATHMQSCCMYIYE